MLTVESHHAILPFEEVRLVPCHSSPSKTAGPPLCANMTETSCVTAISEQGGKENKENQHGNDERFCSAHYRCDGGN
jgi:hypothetical protein